MSEPRGVFGCNCLNIRIHVHSVEEQRASLEDIHNVLKCSLDSSAIQVGLNKLIEIKPGSSIDPSISVVRCLLCRSPVLYFKSPAAQQQRALPLPSATAYLAEEIMDPAAVKDGEKAAEYSQSFGVLLLPHITRDIRPRASTHIPLDMRHRITEYLEKEETAKNERVREFAKAQEEKLDKLRQATMNECSVIAEIINVVNPQSPTIAAARKDSAGASGLAAMLRAGGGGSSVRTGPNPFARPAASGFGMPARLRSNDDDGDIFDLDEDFQTGLPPPESRGRRVTADHQSDEYSEDLEHEENDFGHFGESSGNLSTNPLQQYQAQDVISSRVNVPQQQATASGLGTLMSGSMPQKIPTFGSIGAGGSSFTAGPSLTRREYQMKADEKEMSRRKKEAARGIPKTFVPPHELLDRIHEQDSDLLIGSKPRDSYGWNRKYAPG